jgi:protein TonB
MLGSLGIVGCLLAALFTMNVVAAHKARNAIKMVDMHLPTEPPPPPPPPQHTPKPVQQATVPSPVVAPPPLVQTPAAPVEVMTSPTPPPPAAVVAAGPPSPAPPAPPAVESMGDISSKMIEATPPRYPQDSRRKHEQGTVVLAVLLGVDGRVAEISVSRSSGFERLDRAALAAVQRWRWSPVRRAGVPVMVRGLVEIPFVLKDH